MSYLRSEHPLIFVEGISTMYVYSNGEDIISYGHSNKDLIEMLMRNWETDDYLFKEWLTKQIASKLKVNIRPTPLEPHGEEYKKIEEQAKQGYR